MKPSLSLSSLSLSLSLLLCLSFAEVALSKPRPPNPPIPMRGLNANWRFDAADWWTDSAQAPLLLRNVMLVDSWSGYAASVAGADPAWLVFPAVSVNGHTNLSVAAGTWSAWFSPYWTSQALGGSGPGRSATLFEVGAWSSLGAVGWWSLQVAPDGNSLAFVAMDGLERAEIARAPLAWRAWEWHHLALTYSGLETRLYVDGRLLAVGPAVALVPLTPSSGAQGFALGSDVFGGNLAQGQFDEVAVFGVVREAREIAADYLRLKDTAALGPVTAEEEAQELARLLAQAEAAAPRALGLESEPCEELKAFIERVPPAIHQSLRLTVCGRKPGVAYDWWTTANLPIPPSWLAWSWLATLGPEDTELPVSVVPNAKRFYQLAEVFDLSLKQPTFYVSPYWVPGADGSRDLPFPSLQAALSSPAVPDGAVILVLPGRYRGSTNCNLSFGGRDLVLMSERGWEQTAIDCSGVANSRAFLFDSESPQNRGWVVGFSISNAVNSAVYCGGGSRPLFVNCAFADNSAGAGGAINCANARPLFVNCRFFTNSAAADGGAIYATGADSLVRASHCTFSDNPRQGGGGTLRAANGARMELNNSIVWSVMNGVGAEIVTNGSGGVTATYCDVRGTFAGTGNLNIDPLLEANGTLRLTVNSPCIDQGTTNTFPGCRLLVRYDMDGEARLDHAGFANPVSTADIGADEFVYRPAFELDNNGFSEVDEASGVAYLGTVTAGGEQRAKFAIIDDGIQTNLFIYELNPAGNLIAGRVLVDITNANRSGGVGVANEEIHDLEGITYYEEGGNRRLLVSTSQTKRDRYRDVDNISTDPLVDPPSSDYDRRRNVMIRFELNAQYNPILDQGRARRTFWESENQNVPFSTGYDANNGLIAFIRQQLNAQGPPYQEIDVGLNVLIAWNTTNKFGTPQNGTVYNPGARLPYLGGGPNDAGGAPPTAGTVLEVTAQEIQNERKTLANWATANTWYYFKIWARDANGKYYEGPVSGNATDGRPRLFINEFYSTGLADTDWVEVYNPADRALDMGYISQWIGQLRFRIRNGFFAIPAGSTILAHDYLRFIRAGVAGLNEVQLGEAFDIRYLADDIYLESTSTPSIAIDAYSFRRDQVDDVTEGRAWDAGPRRRNSAGICEGARFVTGSPYPPTDLRLLPPSANQAPPFEHFFVTPDPDQGTIYLEWAAIGRSPAVWRHSPKQHDFHPINLEGIAYRSPTEMIIGLRSPLSVDRRTGNALYFRVTNVSTPPNEFLPVGGWNAVASGITGPSQLNLNGQGIRSIEWCPNGLTNSQGQSVQRYLIIGGPANGGPLEKELFGQKYSLHSWTGNGGDSPVKLIDDLRPYTIRPEGVDLIQVGAEWRILFVEDRYQATGYGTRNAVHWPVSILGNVP